jgi:micrococcal nuclease
LIKLLAAVLAALSFTAPVVAIDICGNGKRVTCVVDGDTFWWQGEKIRIKDLDAPEISEPK